MQLCSIQDIYMFKKAHICSTLSFRSISGVAFGTASMFM